MSQMRVLLRELRAGFSAATVCALILGLLFANFAEAAATKAPSRVARTGAYALCVQHLAHPHGQLRADAKQAAPVDHSSDSHQCPGCCLAVALGSALLPARIVVASRSADPAIVIAYFAASPREPPSLVLGAANGARAPPA